MTYNMGSHDVVALCISGKDLCAVSPLGFAMPSGAVWSHVCVSLLCRPVSFPGLHLCPDHLVDLYPQLYEHQHENHPSAPLAR